MLPMEKDTTIFRSFKLVHNFAKLLFKKLHLEIQKCIANFVNLIISKRKTFIKSKIDFTIDKI